MKCIIKSRASGSIDIFFRIKPKKRDNQPDYGRTKDKEKGQAAKASLEKPQ